MLIDFMLDEREVEVDGSYDWEHTDFIAKHVYMIKMEIDLLSGKMKRSEVDIMPALTRKEIQDIEQDCLQRILDNEL